MWSRDFSTAVQRCSGYFNSALALLLITFAASPALTAPPAILQSEPGISVPLPVKRPDAGSWKTEEPDQWSSEEIIQARKQCAPILRATNAEFESVAPIRKGPCGTPAPVKLSALGAKTRVKITPPATLNCNLVRALNQWLENKVQPLARKRFSSSIIEIRNIASYACRNRYGDPNKKLSEHALVNAIDIASLKLANGKTINLLDHWGETERDRLKAIAQAQAQAQAKARARQIKIEKDEAEKLKDRAGVKAPLQKKSDQKDGSSITADAKTEAPLLKTTGIDAMTTLPPVPPLDDRAQFLRTIHAGACGIFGTVLGPEANQAHANHFHFDLAPRRRSAYCE